MRKAVCIYNTGKANRCNHPDLAQRWFSYLGYYTCKYSVEYKQVCEFYKPRRKLTIFNFFKKKPKT